MISLAEFYSRFKDSHTDSNSINFTIFMHFVETISPRLRISFGVNKSNILAQLPSNIFDNISKLTVSRIKQWLIQTTLSNLIIWQVN